MQCQLAASVVVLLTLAGKTVTEGGDGGKGGKGRGIACMKKSQALLAAGLPQGEPL